MRSFRRYFHHELANIIWIGKPYPSVIAKRQILLGGGIKKESFDVLQQEQGLKLLQVGG